MELDRISNLPNGVMSGLSLKEAARTSILSTRWRYKWEMLPDRVFDDLVFHPSCTFVNIVDHVLLLHPRPIHKFKLSRHDRLATTDMDRWILHLSKKPVVKEIVLEIWKGKSLNIPSCLFSCQDIVYLKLYRCLLNPPRSKFKGFRNLYSLDFQKVTMVQDVFENLMRCSPLLEILKLVDCHGFTNLKIDAPKLRFIHTQGVFREFNLMDSSNLADASFKLVVVVDQVGNSSTFGNFLKLFDHQLPHIQRLTVKREFLKYLSVGVGALPEKLPKPCQYLKFLSVDLNFDNLYEISTVLCLLRSSPALQELEILVKSAEDHAVVGEVNSYSYDNYRYAYPELRFVKLKNISAVKALLDFIESLLLSSPVLERVTVKPASADGLLKLVKDLLMFKRDSKRAEIMVLDP